jgi:large subunit ribosomal protein L15
MVEKEEKKIVYLRKNLLALMNKLKSHKRSKRVGRGKGSGKGKTSGRGDKGQYARNSAPALRLIIKNLIRKLPKRGMVAKPVEILTITTETLKNLVEKNKLNNINNQVIFNLLNTPKRFKQVKLIHSVGVDSIEPITIELNKISQQAQEFLNKNKSSVKIIN